MFLIGLVCAYTDIRYNRIPNKIIIAGLGCAMISYIFVFLYNYFFIGLPENSHYVSEVLSNAALAIVVGYVLWDKKLWSAGDAKLFMVYAALMPLKFYSASFIKFFPSINLLINLFIPLLAILVLKAGIIYFQDFTRFRRIDHRVDEKSSLEEKRKTRIFRLKELGSSLMMFFMMFAFFQIISKAFSGTVFESLFSNPLFIFFSMAILFRKAMDYLKKNKWLDKMIVAIPLVYIGYYGWLGKWGIVFSFVQMVLIMWIVFRVIKQAIAFYIQTREISTVPLRCLKRGDMPCPSAEPLIKEKLSAVNQGDNSGSWGPEGLSAAEVTALAAIPTGEPEITVQIYKTFPFAPYMLLAALICMSTRSSLIALLMQFLG
ncbi:MAG: A24 family peptidase [Patescibacteria group bacterium]|nr:A24 family peptidase [Patescibacteria group bacterium]MCL5261992.1 A24 family peptidase [Patescibacteria group bacterium]